MESLNERTLYEGGFAAAVFGSPSLKGDRVFVNLNRPKEIPIPAYNSKPDAPATLYLDFTCDNEANQGSVPPSEPCCGVGRPKSAIFQATSLEDFSNSNSIVLRVINEIWQAVAEKFAPFNVNVTTVHPGDFSDGKAMRVAVGGLYQDCYRSMLQYR